MIQPAPPPVLISRRQRCALAVSLAAGLFLNGCGRDDGNLNGQLLLEGQPIPGELLFEPLNADNQSEGQSLTAYADSSGWFEVSLLTNEKVTHLRIVIRAAPLTDNGIPGAFDSTSLPEKVVTLKRQLPIENPIVFALTR